MNNFDEYIKNKLNESVEDTFPSDFIKNKIDLEIKSIERKGDFKMKNKKVLLIVCGALVLSMGVFAAGKITGTISSSSSYYNYTNYTDMAKAEKKAGFDANVPENLGKYKFDGITMVDTEDIDDAGSKLNKRKEIAITYKNDAEREIILSIDKASTPISKEEYQEMREIKGTPVYYSRLESLFISDENDATAEELERSKNDPFFNIAIGDTSHERLKSVSKHLIFDYNGLKYSMMADENMDVNEYFDMVGDIIK